MISIGEKSGGIDAMLQSRDILRERTRSNDPCYLDHDQADLDGAARIVAAMIGAVLFRSMHWLATVRLPEPSKCLCFGAFVIIRGILTVKRSIVTEGWDMNTRTQRALRSLEVVLVLAIAGLIFPMVFIALPALQRASVIRSRRNDVSRFRAGEPIPGE